MNFLDWQKQTPQLTPERQHRLWNAATQRTVQLRLVIQDTHHPHNIAACLRSAEAFGVMDVDIVNIKEKFKHRTAAKGVSNWLRIHQYRDVPSCVDTLRKEGFTIAAAFPRSDALPIDQLNVAQKIAVVFGNEHDGVHQAWSEHIDHAFTIPMFGLVESFNISVSCAITLYEINRRRRVDPTFAVNDQQKTDILNLWKPETRD